MFAQHSNYLVKSYDFQESFSVTGMQGQQEFRKQANLNTSKQCSNINKNFIRNMVRPKYLYQNTNALVLAHVTFEKRHSQTRAMRLYNC